MKFTTLTKLSALGLVLVAAPAFANNDSQHNLISFDVSSVVSVENDEATAVMTKTISAKTAKELANKINPIINQALTVAKKYPSVQVSTGNQNAYPEYNKGKIVGVSGSASIHLKSQNTDELSSLMAELQNTLLLESLNFDVSDRLREKTQSQLRDEATKKFQAEANAMVKAWGAKNYRLVNAQMNSSTQYYGRGGMASMMFMKEAVAAEAAAPAQELQVGKSDITYRINGTIQLIY